jgi:hypothetical protein
VTDLDEQSLIRDLHSRPLPVGQPDIGQRSIALGRRMRRRRRGAAAAVLALALIMGFAFGGGNQLGRLDPQPVSTQPAPQVSDPSSAGRSSLSPTNLSRGPTPLLSYVHDGVANGHDGLVVNGSDDEKIALADPGSLLMDRSDAFVDLGERVLALRDLDPGPGERLGYSLDDELPVRVPGAGPRVVGGAQPGPDGSVLIPADGGYAVARPGGSWSFVKHLGDPSKLGAPPLAPVTDAVFHTQRVGSTTVVRRSELDPKVGPVDNEQWIQTVTGNPATDRFVALDSGGCQHVQLHSPFTTVYSTCAWDLKRLSSDGLHAVGLSAEFGWALVNLRTMDPVLVFGKDGTIDADSFHFDGLGQVNFVISSDTNEYAILVCTVDGGCWQATDWSPTRYFIVQPSSD